MSGMLWLTPALCEWLEMWLNRCSRRPRSAAGRQFFKGRGIQSTMFFDAVAGPGLELIEVPAGFGHPDDRHVQVPPFDHRLQSREDLFVSQIAGGAEKDQRIRMRESHRCSLFFWGFFHVPAELEPHGREKFILEIRIAARAESFIQGRGEYRHRNAFVDGGLDGPSSFARV